MSTFIHLLYVPTMDCNMRCTYCYLGDHTTETGRDRNPVDTLKFAVDKLRGSGVVPFNISLHGGEVTTLPPEEFRELCAYITEYYSEQRPLLREFGFNTAVPHIKTNLYGLGRHIDAIRDYKVTVSGSLDLPLSMHSRYRLDKGGHDTLPVILRNIGMLKDIDCHKKVSATIFKEHMAELPQIIEDIKWLHENTCLDMNDFNFMFGFASPDAPGGMTPLTREEQVEFYDAIHAAFEGTDLQPGLDRKWFAEFTPDYCTGCVNCGEKFFLLQRNGDIFSCVRGQGHPEFRYGNIFTDSVEDILDTARQRILSAHRRTGFSDGCGECPYLYVCNTGCPFVKNNDKDPVSYTCLLQKRLFLAAGTPEGAQGYARWYLERMHPERAQDFDPPDTLPDGSPSLNRIIREDKKLAQVYDPAAFILNADGEDIHLRSQLLKNTRDIIPFVPGMTEISLYVRRDVMDALCDDPINNSLYIMLLSGETVVYGDEQREKQAHVMTHQVYRFALERMPSDREGFFRVPLGELLSLYAGQLGSGYSNLFFTTAALRDYHYQKQRNNGWYHRQAMNLPFQNIELSFINFPGKGEVLK